MSQILRATFRIVTPMFIGGAEPKLSVEIRAPSIKGALRFWYRALYPKADPQEELSIFGGSDKGVGQSRFLLKIPQQNMRLKHGESRDQRWNGSKIAYLGYGVIDRKSTGETKIEKGKEKEVKKQMTIRPYLKEGSCFSLEIRFKPRQDKESEEEYDSMRRKVMRSLWVLIMLGGLGARSRKGFGSLAVMEEIEGMDDDLPSLMPKSPDELLQALEVFFKEFDAPSINGNAYPEFTSFSTRSSYVVTKTQGDAMDTLEWLGDTIHKYRSFKGSSSQQWVGSDHDLMRDWIKSGGEPPNPPKRAAFGLPHNYFFTSLDNKKGEVNLMENNKKGRRAAPLLFHIHEFPSSNNNHQACVVATFLPARLIPENKTVHFSRDSHPETCDLPIPDDFTAVKELLEKIADDGGKVDVWEHVHV